MKRFAITLALCFAAGAASAHEFFLLPDSFAPETGAELGFAAHSSHHFLEAEEAEGLDSVTASLVAAGQTRDAALTAKEKEIAGVATLGDAPASWLVGHRLGQVWSQTADGWKPGGRDKNPGAKTAANYEKFSKVLLKTAGKSWKAPLGHQLEIVPLADPNALKPGDELPVQVLFDGAPIATTVSATFAGFSSQPNTYAYVTETLSEGPQEGAALVKTWSPGVWMIRAQHTAAGGEGFDKHVLRATLLFEVEG